ncbi:MAG: ABC transporter permease [Acidobacteriota bacterium]
MTRPQAPAPPLLARMLARLLPAGENRAFLAADLDEEFSDLVTTVGVPTARRWYWKQVCLSGPPLLRQRVSALTSSLFASVAPVWRGGRTSMLQGLATDLRYTWRVSRRAPVVTISVILGIALGIAASTAIFSVMESVFLRPLPFPAPDRLVRFSTTVENIGRVPEVNYLDARDWQAASTRLEAIGLYDVEPGTVRLGDDAPPFSATLMLATAEVIPVLGIRPLIGRALSPDEYQFGATPAVMLGYRFWKAHFGGDPAAVGRMLQVGGERQTIVGVLPPEADRFPAGGADVWTTLAFPPSSFLNQRGSIALSAIGRLRGDATIAAAQNEISTVAARLRSAYPDTNRDRAVRLEGLQDAMVGPLRPMMVLLALSVAMLLAVACANIANLLLAQAHARTLELGIRGAVGASPGRLARQLWTESLALFAVAGGLGAAIASPLAQWLVSRYPDTLPLAADVALDGRVLAVAAASTLAAALLAGFPRVRRLRNTRIGLDLRGDARSGLTLGHRRMTNVLVAAQISVSIVLVFGGVLLLRTFINLTSTVPGFDPDGVIAIRASIPPLPHGDAVQVAALQDSLRDAASSLPGVTAAAHAMFIPFAPGAWGDGYRRTGTADPAPRGPMAHFFMVSPDYLGVMRIPVLRGRGLSATDGTGAPPVLLVSETFANTAFPGQDPVGRRLEWNGGTWEIVGVTGDIRHAALSDPLDADVYVPRRQVVRSNTWLLLKTARPAAAVLAELRERVKSINPDVALTDAAAMDRRLAESAAPERFRAIVTGTLAGLTFLLAIVGLHGVVSYAVMQRTREIGVRLALGQRPAAVVGAVMVDTLRTIAAGAVPGVLAAVYAGRWLSSVVMVNADQTAVLAGVVGILAVAAIAAAAGPAWTASRVDPLTALRSS